MEYDNLPEIARLAINRMPMFSEKEKTLLHRALDAILDASKAYTDANGGNFLENIVEDLTPQLGGTLDANGNTIDMGVNIITDAKVGEWDTAYSWGDHALAGYLLNVVEDTTPQLGGNLDVNGNGLVSTANGDIPITPDGSGKVILDGLNWPTSDGTADYVLKTDGAGNLSWTAQTGGGGGINNVVEDTTPQLGGNLDLNSKGFVIAGQTVGGSNGNVVLNFSSVRSG